MPAYSVSRQLNGSLDETIGVRATNFELKLIRIDIANIAPRPSGPSAEFLNYSLLGTLYRYPTATISGGDVLTASRMRTGAPASSTTQRGGAVTFSGGTAELIVSSLIGQGSNGSIQVPSDLTVTPGGAIRILMDAFNTADISARVTIFFEELRLATHV